MARLPLSTGRFRLPHGCRGRLLKRYDSPPEQSARRNGDRAIGETEKDMQTLVAYVENKPGVLNRVSSLARRLAINIDSLTVGPTENEEIARITIVAHTDERGPHRLQASLENLVDVLLAQNTPTRQLLYRDLALIKVSA